MENETTKTKEQVYAKYVLMAKSNLQAKELDERQKKMITRLTIAWFVCILWTLLVYLLISRFNLPAFIQLITGNVGYWTIAGAIFLGVILAFIVETRKPKPVPLDDIYKEAENLIQKAKKNAKEREKELSLLPNENEI